MRNVFNAVAVILDTALDIQKEMRKAAFARGAEVFNKITPALHEVTESLKESALPGVVLRAKNFQGELAASTGEYLPAIAEAAVPMHAALQALQSTWKDLTATEAEKELEARRILHECEVYSLEETLKDLPKEYDMSGTIAARVRELAEDVRTNCLTEEQLRYVKETHDRVGDLIKNEPARATHLAMADGLYKEATALMRKLDPRLFELALETVQDVRQICSFGRAWEEARALTPHELAHLEGVRSQIAAAAAKSQFEALLAEKIQAGDYNTVYLNRED